MVLKRRLPALFSLLIYLMTIFPAAAGALVLCRGYDGHVALEPVFFAVQDVTAEIEDKHTYRGRSTGDPIAQHHVTPCRDSTLVFLQGGTDKPSSTRPAPSPSSPDGPIAQPVLPQNFAASFEGRRLDENCTPNTTLRCLRTVILLN